MKHKALKTSKRLLAMLLAMLIASTMGVPAFAQGGKTEEKNYTIDSPYEGVDWEKWSDYKTQLHSHTNVSDGFLTIKEYVAEHYAFDYDIVALTDHGTLNQGWNKQPELIPLVRLVKYERTQLAPIYPIPDDEYQQYINGTHPERSYTTQEGVTVTRTHTCGMLDVPKGIELNMATPVADCHLTGYFCDYGQGLAGVFGDYETPSAGVKREGGISFLSHVGEFVFLDKDWPDRAGQKVDDYYASKFARLFIDNAGSSLGMGINSAIDDQTRCDRILYDQVLQKTIPNGVVPWSNTFADSHNDRRVNDAYVMSWMPELTLEDFRACMEKGQFFSVSHYSNGIELNGMPEMPGYNMTEDEIDASGLFYLNNTPRITKLVVDNDKDTVTVEGENANIITWVSNGEVIKREDLKDGKAILDLHNDELLNEPYLYLRCYISGDNGICYANPLVLHVEGEEFAPVKVKRTHDISTFLRKLVTVIDLCFFRLNPIIWAFKYFALGYNPITWDRIIKPF